VKKQAWILALLGIAALPLVADRVRARSERCALDGVAVAVPFRARIVAADRTTRSFCGVRCAHLWLARSGLAARTILVTDCVSGREIDARDAWFVRSASVWGGGAPDFIRVFAERSAAERHAQAYRGKILSDADRPFGVYLKEGADHASPGE
jgi:hypothetical protein